MAYIGQPPLQEFTSPPTKDSFTGDGSTTYFDMAQEVVSGGENALEVFIDNVRQEPGSGKSFTLGNDGSDANKRITFTAAPANGAVIYVLNDKTNLTAIAPTATDLNGVELILDSDADTSITADSDDQIDIKIGGADDFQFTANTFTALSGSTIKANTIAETTATSGVTIDGVLLKDGVLGANTVDSDAYVDGSIDTAHIANDQITAALIADNAIDSDMYVDGSIDTAHIADDQVTLAKMAGLARGKIIYGDSSGNPAALTVGSSGQALVSDGTDISWGAGGAISTYSNSTNNRVITSVDSSSVNSEANLTFDGSTLAVTGAATVNDSVTAATFEPTGDTSASDNAAIGYTGAEGLILTGQGSTNDVTIKNDADADVITIATGATNVDIVGDVTASTVNADGDTAAGDNAAMGYTAGEGLILTGQGSTNDITIKNDADAAVISIPTGTTNATVAGTLTATAFAGSGASLTGIVSKGKNILLNGAMAISQRSTSTVAQANDSNEGFATVDRWSLEFGNSAGGTITTSQNSAWGSDNGFAFNYKLDVTTADASISGTELVFFRQTIEAQHMRSCGWNYLSSSSDITLSFWVYNSKTGIYCIALGSYDGTGRMYTAEYTVSSANTWEKKTITIPGYSGLSFDNDSNAGLTLYFMLANASGRYGTADSWTSGNAFGTSNQVNFLDSTSNVAYYTGIQLEVGDSATDFEHRQYGEEFALCQRYYQEHDGIKCQFSRLQMSDFDGHTQGFFCSHPTMRANPTLTRGTQYTWYGNDSSWTTTSGKWALQPYNPTHIFTEGSYDGGTGNGVIQIKCDITLDAEI